MQFLRPFFMKIKHLTQAALLATVYAVLNYYQNFLLPGSASWAFQFRVAECLCVIAFFTPAAIWGFTAGCMIFNLAFVGALPLDFLVGSLATLLSTVGMYLTRNLKIRNYPLFGMLLPAVFNGLLVGWELSACLGSIFWLNFLYIAAGELAVLLIFGTALYYIIRSRRLQAHIFS